jgi:hypothetical protein
MNALDRCLAAQVIEGDVNEALRLMNMSKISLEDEDVQEQVQHDPVREAFSKVPRHRCCLVAGAQRNAV